jgi:hypothetical protein
VRSLILSIYDIRLIDHIFMGGFLALSGIDAGRSNRLPLDANTSRKAASSTLPDESIGYPAK